jgi:hypothetical protein
MFNNSGIAQRYSNRVRIGNWSEDFELERLRMQDFLLRKSRGELTVTKFQVRVYCNAFYVSSQDGCLLLDQLYHPPFAPRAP